MIRIEGYDDHTPTRRLIAAIRDIDPDLAAAYDRRYADLTILPRPTDLPRHERAATRDAWYDVYWTHPALVTRAEPGEEYIDVQHVRIAHLATLPPPPRIPAAERIAAADPVSLDDYSDRAIALHGGAEALRETLTDRRDTVIEHDRSVDAYDWTVLARRVVELARAATPRKLTPGQRARAAGARLLETYRRADADRASLHALINNAIQDGDTTTATELRTFLNGLTDALAKTEAPKRGRGRPAIGPPTTLRLGPELTTQIDQAKRNGETRADTVRRLLTDGLLAQDFAAWAEAQQVRCERHSAIDDGLAERCYVCWYDFALIQAIGKVAQSTLQDLGARLDRPGS